MTTEVVPVATGKSSIEIGQHRVDSLGQRSFKTIRNTFFPSVSLNRLRNTFDIVDSELRMVISEANSQDNKLVASWQQRSQSLLVGAREAYNEGNAELGWRRLKAADRFMLYGLDAVSLTIEAGSILAEANDDGKELSKWRKTRVQELICDDKGKLKATLAKSEVVRAKRILDEHYDNVYQKSEILKNRLLILTLMCFVAVVVWLCNPPFSPYPSSLLSETVHSPRLAWLGILLTGILGAILSGFSSSMATDQKKTRIPLEISASTITLARIAMATVASLAVAILFASGLLSIAKPTYEMMLAVALAGGFSDRLLLRGIDVASK